MSLPGEPLDDQSPIRTPWPIRWQRFRYRVLPVVMVLICAAIAAWIWSRQGGSGSAVGEVETRRAALSSPTEGVLAALPGKEVEVFDRVKKGDVVARLEGGPLREQRALRQVELDRLRQDIAAVEIATTRPSAPPQPAGPSIDALQVQAVAKMLELENLDRRLEALEIRAPFGGVVTHVQRLPGQTVIAGQSIVEIAGETGTYVVSYIRQEQVLRPAPNMTVVVHTTGKPRRTFSALVKDVGVQYQSIPHHQLRDQKIPEWGVPVRIVMPAGANLKPGELVQLVFKRTAG